MRTIGYSATFAVLAVLVSLAINLEGVAMETEPKTVTVTEKDDGAKIKLAKGDTMVLKLPEQAGTAFGWKIVKSDEKVSKLQGKPEYEKSKDEKPKVGGKRMMVWTFKAETVGMSALEMHYVRPFDKDKPPAKTFKLTVQVEGK